MPRKATSRRKNIWPFPDSRLSARQTTPATGGGARHMRRKATTEEDKLADALARKYEKARAKAAFVPAKKRMSDKSILAELMRENPTYYVIKKQIGGPDELILHTKDKKEAQAFVKKMKGWGTFQIQSKRNPADAAAEGFKEFHGHDSKEEVTVKKKVHHHTHLSGAGELRGLKVDGVDGYRHTIGGFRKAILAFNESKNQLFVEGGDQSIDLKVFGIRKPHELETLGKVTDIDYHTSKSHLGDEGGTAVYQHRFRTTNEDGKHVVVAIAKYPDLIYRVLEEQLEFSGGSYFIRAEGIDQ